MEALTNPNEAEDIDERLRESMMSDIVSAVDRLRQQHDEQLKKLESIKNEPVRRIYFLLYVPLYLLLYVLLYLLLYVELVRPTMAVIYCRLAMWNR